MHPDALARVITEHLGGGHVVEENVIGRNPL
jgi:(2Fe-2S) ferredoxin